MWDSNKTWLTHSSSLTFGGSVLVRVSSLAPVYLCSTSAPFLLLQSISRVYFSFILFNISVLPLFTYPAFSFLFFFTLNASTCFTDTASATLSTFTPACSFSPLSPCPRTSIRDKPLGQWRLNVAATGKTNPKNSGHRWLTDWSRTVFEENCVITQHHVTKTGP